MDDRELLRHIGRLPGGKAGYKQLVRELGLGGGQERRELREQLGRLTGRRQLTQIDGQHWAIPQAAPVADKRESAGRPALRPVRRSRACPQPARPAESPSAAHRSASAAACP